MVYAVIANVTYMEGEWRASKQIPTFFLDSAMQGIRDIEHAEKIAKNMLEITPNITAHVCAYQCDESAVIIRGL